MPPRLASQTTLAAPSPLLDRTYRLVPNDPPVADHVIPRGIGGSDDPTNLRAAHRSCNGRKGQELGTYGGLYTAVSRTHAQLNERLRPGGTPTRHDGTPAALRLAEEVPSLAAPD